MSPGAKSLHISQKGLLTGKAWVDQYIELLASSFAAKPTPLAENLPRRGRQHKQRAAKNLLDDFDLREAHV